MDVMDKEKIYEIRKEIDRIEKKRKGLAPWQYKYLITVLNLLETIK